MINFTSSIMTCPSAIVSTRAMKPFYTEQKHTELLPMTAKLSNYCNTGHS